MSQIQVGIDKTAIPAEATHKGLQIAGYVCGEWFLCIAPLPMSPGQALYLAVYRVANYGVLCGSH